MVVPSLSLRCLIQCNSSRRFPAAFPEILICFQNILCIPLTKQKRKRSAVLAWTWIGRNPAQQIPCLVIPIFSRGRATSEVMARLFPNKRTHYPTSRSFGKPRMAGAPASALCTLIMPMSSKVLSLFHRDCTCRLLRTIQAEALPEERWLHIPIMADAPVRSWRAISSPWRRTSTSDSSRVTELGL